MRTRANAHALVIALVFGAAAATDAAAQPPKPPAQPTKPPAPRKAPAPIKFLTFVIGAHHAAGTMTRQTRPVIYVENADVTSAFRAGTGPSASLGTGVQVKGRFFIAAGVGTSRATSDLVIAAEVPRPTSFGQPRSTSGRTPARRQTIDVDVDGLWRLRQTRRLWIAAGGGLAASRVSQQVDADLQLDEVFPFDTVRIRSVGLTRARATGVGAGVTLQAAWMLRPKVGLLGDLRWRSVSPTVTTGTVRVDVPAGGVRAGFGLHVRF